MTLRQWTGRPSASVTKSCTPSVTSGCVGAQRDRDLVGRVADHVEDDLDGLRVGEVLADPGHDVVGDGRRGPDDRVREGQGGLGRLAGGRSPVVVDRRERRLVGARRDRRDRPPGLAEPAVVLHGPRATAPARWSSGRGRACRATARMNSSITPQTSRTGYPPRDVRPVDGPNSWSRTARAVARRRHPDHLDDGELVLAGRVGERRPAARRRCRVTSTRNWSAKARLPRRLEHLVEQPRTGARSEVQERPGHGRCVLLQRSRAAELAGGRSSVCAPSLR